MSDSDDKFLEHLLPILASVALCAGGAYYWSYRVERNKEEAVKEFTECVKDHLRDPMHYLTPGPFTDPAAGTGRERGDVQVQVI